MFRGSMKKPGWLGEEQQGLMGVKDERVRKMLVWRGREPFDLSQQQNLQKDKKQ